MALLGTTSIISPTRLLLTAWLTQWLKFKPDKHGSAYGPRHIRSRHGIGVEVNEQSRKTLRVLRPQAPVAVDAPAPSWLLVTPSCAMCANAAPVAWTAMVTVCRARAYAGRRLTAAKLLQP